MHTVSLTFDFFSLETIEALAQDYGYWAIFFGIMLENMGLPLPGETVTLVGGFLAGSEELLYRWVLSSAIAGAVLGDSMGYWIGFYGGWPLLLKLGSLFRIDEAALVNIREQFSQNADKAVIFGRFVALLRIFAGPLAGIAQMPYWKFLLCNLLGASLWGTAMVTLAFFVGRLIPLATLVGWVAQFTVAALVLVVLWVSVFWWLERRQHTPAPD
ncbi:membrane protein [Leptolyngbya sp. Heron Island J]|uniref:DedA family protein n=1 Tax=Leptolyngbya sp. Heron Island J TaxID=1385935 RepID=UPI0003B9A7AA|nr:DedA family protein [Leptolyngbya sp. Heron Island J]ESA35365.1 membrane protein [Leptolyngbya sp. Heron Island J]